MHTLENRPKKQNSLIVVDEVTTGIGRTGAWFGFQHYGLLPDIVAVGKGIGNGYPVSVAAINRETAFRLEKKDFHYAQSHQNDALGCAVAREVVNVIQEDGLIERSQRVGSCFRKELELLGKKHPCIKETRGRGLMLALEFKPVKEGFQLARAHRALFERGFLVGYKPAANLLRFYPSLTIKEDDIKDMLENPDQILAKEYAHD